MHSKELEAYLLLQKAYAWLGMSFSVAIGKRRSGIRLALDNIDNAMQYAQRYALTDAERAWLDGRTDDGKND